MEGKSSVLSDGFNPGERMVIKREASRVSDWVQRFAVF